MVGGLGREVDGKGRDGCQILHGNSRTGARQGRGGDTGEAEGASGKSESVSWRARVKEMAERACLQALQSV